LRRLDALLGIVHEIQTACQLLLIQAALFASDQVPVWVGVHMPALVSMLQHAQ